MVDQVNTITSMAAEQLAANIITMLSGPAGWFRFTNAPAEGRESGPIFIHASTLVAFAPLGANMEVRTASASWLVRENYLSLIELLDVCRSADSVLVQMQIKQVRGLTAERFPDIDFNELAEQVLAIKDRLL